MKIPVDVPPSIKNALDKVGLDVSAQTKPREIIVPPPSEVISPWPVAEVVVTSVAAVVSTVGTTMVENVLCAP